MASRAAAPRLPRGRAPDRAGLAVLGLAALQALVAGVLLQGWVAAGVLLHLGCCALLPLLLRQDPPLTGWSGAVLRVMAAALPGLGPVAALAGLVALFAGAPRQLGLVRPLPDDPLEARLTAIAAPPAARGGAPLPEGLLLEALGDVLRWGNAAQKARALDLAALGGRRGGETLLHLALFDPDPALRARAEALRPGVERRLLSEVEALREQEDGPDSPGARALARQLDRAAYSGLLQADRAALCRAEAAGLWQAIAERAPEDAEAQAALGRDLMVLGDLPAARAALEAALAHGVATANVLGWLAECLFRARDFASLEALVARWRPVLESATDHDGPLSPAWRLWLGAGRP
jgi:hypothetical protein